MIDALFLLTAIVNIKFKRLDFELNFLFENVWPNIYKYIYIYIRNVSLNDTAMQGLCDLSQICGISG